MLSLRMQRWMQLLTQIWYVREDQLQQRQGAQGGHRICGAVLQRGRVACGAEGFGSLPGALEALRGRRWGSRRGLRKDRNRREPKESAVGVDKNGLAERAFSYTLVLELAWWLQI